MKYHFRFASAVLLTAAMLTLTMCAKQEEAKTEETEATEETAAEQPAESDRGVASATFGEVTVSIDYGRPQLGGRDMLAKATEGMVWRMGMNEATEIETAGDLHFGETVIPQGKYSLWMRKQSGDQWELVFNKKTGIWGHEYPAEDELVAVPMTTSESADSVETFTIEIEATGANAGILKALWGPAVVSAEFTVSTSGTM